MKVFFKALPILVCVFFYQFALAQKGSSLVIHDNTGKANGGENATSNLRSEIESALNKEKPCVDIMDDQDIRNVLESERERTCSKAATRPGFKDIGTLMGASYVMVYRQLPAAGGTVYTAFVMDPQTGKTIARQTGTDAKEVASIVGQLWLNPAGQLQTALGWRGQI
ncbi:MAG: hypothetical protein IPM85_15125 [Chitinophagaceae bacterium]|nr:hypothetical protein [Chitinophagaceae bacterium]